MKLIKMYFGRDKPTGGLVHIHEIHNFISQEVATQYEGFTLAFALRYWRGRSEESFTIEVTDPSLDFRASQIANAYKARFAQEAVLITSQDVEMELV